MVIANSACHGPCVVASMLELFHFCVSCGSHYSAAHPIWLTSPLKGGRREEPQRHSFAALFRAYFMVVRSGLELHIHAGAHK